MPKSIKNLQLLCRMYNDKVNKNFFKDENQRNLWIRLNAEHIQYVNKKTNGIDKPLGEIGQTYSFMQISANQLDYDEHMCNAPRFSFEELVFPHDELWKLEKRKNGEKLKNMFGEIDGITLLSDIDDGDL